MNAIAYMLAGALLTCGAYEGIRIWRNIVAECRTNNAFRSYAKRVFGSEL